MNGTKTTETPNRKDLTMHKPANKIHGRIRLAFEDDPDTPVMVYLMRHRASATYECATQTAEVENEPLTDAELAWLEIHRELADDWYDYRVRRL